MGSLSKPVPFVKEDQLNSDLDHTQLSSSSMPGISSPFTHLPGHPRVLLSDTQQLATFLKQEFCAPDLEKMAPYLWMMSTPSSTNISPLHHQLVKGREIIVTEYPRLHLVWIYDRVFIKPIPKYLFSFAFWNDYLCDDKSSLPSRAAVRQAALGYLRTYRYLIQHESDFSIAQQDHLRLVPKEIDWPSFCKFTSRLDSITNCDVSPRYSYGELRLTRLNFYAKFILRKSRFEQLHGQYGVYFGRFYGPLLFVFGVLSIMLSAMQLEMAAEQFVVHKWTSFWQLSRWFSVVSFGGTAGVAVFLICLLTWMIADEWIYAIRCLLQKKAKKFSV